MNYWSFHLLRAITSFCLNLGAYYFFLSQIGRNLKVESYFHFVFETQQLFSSLHFYPAGLNAALHLPHLSCLPSSQAIVFIYLRTSTRPSNFLLTFCLTSLPINFFFFLCSRQNRLRIISCKFMYLLLCHTGY